MFETLIRTIAQLARELLSSKVVKTGLLLCIGLLVTVFTVAEINYRLSPWSSEAKVRQRLLLLTPMGTSVEKVKSIIQTERWRIYYEKRFEQTITTETSYPGVKGTHAIGVDFGKHFGIPFPYRADAYWGFDQSGKMVDLKVRVLALGL